ncbi:hypothetical protein Rt10032_c17g5792 [Rhodotorula toruloides]|uniref:Uncharacterized protein n=1 Tax=Rhodotorula toruloides TaxID=5286 RepID=A0A511KPB2_RHOTO|nr:hypothetical protein Rt10032_c17g5792 [Rhodotorula toruloides]
MTPDLQAALELLGKPAQTLWRKVLPFVRLSLADRLQTSSLPQHTAVQLDLVLDDDSDWGLALVERELKHRGVTDAYRRDAVLASIWPEHRDLVAPTARCIEMRFKNLAEYTTEAHKQGIHELAKRSSVAREGNYERTRIYGM